MHPWGKWGRNFVEYGVAAARDALADAGLAWTDVQFVSGADTIRNGYPGFISGATSSHAGMPAWRGVSSQSGGMTPSRFCLANVSSRTASQPLSNSPL